MANQPVQTCPKCGAPMPPACAMQDPYDNKWYNRQVCDNPQCRTMTFNQGPFQSAAEASPVGFAQGPGQ